MGLTALGRHGTNAQAAARRCYHVWDTLEHHAMSTVLPDDGRIAFRRAASGARSTRLPLRSDWVELACLEDTLH
jgi:hypothetical protein